MPISNPFSPTSTKNAVILFLLPLGVSSSPVEANTIAKSGITGPEIKCLDPFKIQSLPSFFALVFIDIISEPASGSVKAKSSLFSPVTQGSRYLFFCSSLQAKRISVGLAAQACNA